MSIIKAHGELTRVRIKAVYLHPKHNIPTIFLSDETGDVILSLVVGFLEAQSILIGWQKLPTPRPLTADLLRDIIEQDFSARIDCVVIEDVRGGAFISVIVIRHGEHVIERDCRPSDALALTVRVGAPVYLTKNIIEKTKGERENAKALLAYIEAEAKDSSGKDEILRGQA